MLDTLPLEIMQMIMQDVPDIRDIVNLSMVSKHLHRKLIGLANERFTIRADENRLNQWTVPSPMKTYFRGDGSRDVFCRLWHVKDLEFIAPIYDHRRDRCRRGFTAKGSCYGEEKTKRNQTIHKELMDSLFEEFQHALFHLPKNSLQRFAWHMGCCIPGKIIGCNGWLPLNQEGIESLSLITDGTTCSSRECDDYGLLKLRQLQHLSWKGLNPRDDHIVLHQLLGVNREGLVSLELENIDSDGCLHISQLIGGYGTVKSVIRFRSLQHLSLSNISLTAAQSLMRSAFPLENLTSLKLFNCGSGLAFLDKVTKPSRGINLQSFEISILETSEARHELGQYLTRFQGLEELYVATTDSRSPFTGFILHHKKTLKRFVHHERFDDSDNDRQGKIYDLALDWEIPVGEILCKLQLDALGVCTSPSKLMNQLTTVSQRPALKLLHFRITARSFERRDLLADLVDNGYEIPGVSPRRTQVDKVIYRYMSSRCAEFMSMKDLLQFAEWAFGRNGLPELQVLAYGDFSHDGRYKWTNLLFCRSLPTASSEPPTKATRSFRLMSQEDEYLLDRIEGGRKMLSVCPAEGTLEYDSNSDGQTSEDERSGGSSDSQNDSWLKFNGIGHGSF